MNSSFTIETLPAAEAEKHISRPAEILIGSVEDGALVAGGHVGPLVFVHIPELDEELGPKLRAGAANDPAFTSAT